MKNLQKLGVKQEKYNLYDSHSVIHLAKNPSSILEPRTLMWDIIGFEMWWVLCRCNLRRSILKRMARIWWPRYCHKKSCLYVARQRACRCPPHESDGKNVGYTPNVGYEEMALWSLVGGPNRCKSPSTFRVMNKGHFRRCTWGKDMISLLSSHHNGVKKYDILHLRRKLREKEKREN
jgi:hypothetical protein